MWTWSANGAVAAAAADRVLRCGVGPSVGAKPAFGSSGGALVTSMGADHTAGHRCAGSTNLLSTHEILDQRRDTVRLFDVQHVSGAGYMRNLHLRHVGPKRLVAAVRPEHGQVFG